ncbi:peptide-methionine (R)-S-oxide reductase MsrB [Jeongeupia wiesaeckerbachi]|uniref:peptide-methionine (R)-S-oxide reductase MsrB n=1 Tax=Jeongeupia wiesaeckerbachi TaxID=3051218 RepID=UPI003D804923
MQIDTDPGLPGILGQAAPELGVRQWVDAAGQPLASYGLAEMPGAYKLLFCFQDACPGCHSHGFPSLIKLVEGLRGSRIVSFAAVQTAFEDFEANNYERMLAAQQRYALLIPFGHDAGEGRHGAGSVLMERFRNGGTPWFIVIDPDGNVVYNHFHIDADKTIAFFRRAETQPPPAAVPPGILTWREVLQLARDGNPPPPRRVERTDEQWRAVLTPEQYRITRQAGTERAHSSDLCSLFEPGRYACVCCETELFDAASKFKSSSGWPSFTQAIAPGVVAYHRDDGHGMVRIETTCNVCDAHLGHVFPDGPEPSGLRYCMNAVALKKLPEA